MAWRGKNASDRSIKRAWTERMHGDRGRRQATEESHPRDRAGPVAALGRGTGRAHRADDFRDRAAAGRDDEKARLEGRGKQFFQDVSWLRAIPHFVVPAFAGTTCREWARPPLGQWPVSYTHLRAHETGRN